MPDCANDYLVLATVDISIASSWKPVHHAVLNVAIHWWTNALEDVHKIEVCLCWNWRCPNPPYVCLSFRCNILNKSTRLYVSQTLVGIDATFIEPSYWVKRHRNAFHVNVVKYHMDRCAHFYSLYAEIRQAYRKMTILWRKPRPWCELKTLNEQLYRSLWILVHLPGYLWWIGY
jgi:hypothetical protein